MKYADRPSSWLMLFHPTDRGSLLWAQWYADRYPGLHTLSVNCSTTEHITRNEYVQSILNVVRQHLEQQPLVARQIMGIIIGYGLPTSYYLDDHPILPAYGCCGRSIASSLSELDWTPPKWMFPQSGNGNYWGAGHVNPLCGTTDRISLDMLRAAANQHSRRIYMAVSMGAPSLEAAKRMTYVSDDGTPTPVPIQWNCAYDYTDNRLGTWGRLRAAVEQTMPEYPNCGTWEPFESDCMSTPSANFRLSWSRAGGWLTGERASSDAWRRNPCCPAVLCYDQNSYGAVCVRTKERGGGYLVPVALDNGYMAAIGATAEPGKGTGPHPEQIMSYLSRGWSLGEAVWAATPLLSHYWQLNGNPLSAVKPLATERNNDD